MSRHYHVHVGTPGYMPEVNDIYPTMREAEQGIKFWADQYREDGQHIVEGSMRLSFYRVMPKDASPYTLPTYIEIVRCFDDCDSDD